MILFVSFLVSRNLWLVFFYVVVFPFNIDQLLVKLTATDFSLISHTLYLGSIKGAWFSSPR